MKQYVGIALLIVGVVLLVLGFQEFVAFGSRISRALGGGPSERAWLLMIGGVVCTVLGSMGIFKK